MIDFTRNFTDGDHHAKEEDLLFPLLEERSSAAGGTISVLLSEHQAARECIRAIDRALRDAAGADDERAAAARGVIVENLRLYAFLLPLHIGKEDTILFSLTDNCSACRSRRCWRGFDRLADARGGPRSAGVPPHGPRARKASGGLRGRREGGASIGSVVLEGVERLELADRHGVFTTASRLCRRDN